MNPNKAVNKGRFVYRQSMRRDAQWLINSGGMKREEIARYFHRSRGWVTHLLKGAWHEIRVTEEQAHLMRAILRREQVRAKLPRDVYTLLREAQEKVGDSLEALDRVERALYNMRRRK